VYVDLSSRNTERGHLPRTGNAVPIRGTATRLNVAERQQDVTLVFETSSGPIGLRIGRLRFGPWHDEALSRSC